MNHKPLKGYKVIELATHVAVPSAARIMADWGAEVIKVESLTGDPWRKAGVIYNLPVDEKENPLFTISNTNKKSIVLDLKNAKGREILYKLLDDADVFMSNTRLLALEKLGLDKNYICKKYPKLVYAHFTGFGEKGPDASRPGFDLATFWARSGAMIDWTAKGQFPFRPTGGFGDSATGTSILSGILAALLKREKTGKGDYVTCSLYSSAIWYNSTSILASQEQYGNNYPKGSLEASSPISWTYRCKDGEWLIITLIEYDKYFPIMCDLLGIHELIEDPRFKNLKKAKENIEEICTIFNKAFAKKTRKEWEEIFKKNDIVYEKLVHTNEIIKDEQAWINNYIYDYEFENGNKAVLPATPVKFESAGTIEYNRHPIIGENTIEILNKLGYSEVEISEMINEKFVK